jgi:hypothetical protein
MEYMLANCAFPSMDMGRNQDQELQRIIRSGLFEHLFEIKNFPQEITLAGKYTYRHREGVPIFQCIDKN